MYTQSHKSELKTDKQPRHANTTTMTVVPNIPAKDAHTKIAEAAYYAAERRGFAPGFELHDWLTAEREVETTLSSKD